MFAEPSTKDASVVDVAETTTAVASVDCRRPRFLKQAPNDAGRHQL